MQKHCPLVWPRGWKRTPELERRPSKFHYQRRRLTITEGYGRVAEQIPHLGDFNTASVSTDWPIYRSNGRYGERGTYHKSHRIEDPGASVYFFLDGTERVFASDHYNSIADNLAAIAKHLEAMRGMLRWGVGDMRQAFAGYAALPPSQEEWWLVLGIPRTSAIEEVQDAFRRLAIDAHPDHGGREHDMARLNAARDAALFDIRGSLNAVR